MGKATRPVSVALEKASVRLSAFRVVIRPVRRARRATDASALINIEKLSTLADAKQRMTGRQHRGRTAFARRRWHRTLVPSGDQVVRVRVGTGIVLTEARHDQSRLEGSTNT